jgi:hypothetical protein
MPKEQRAKEIKMSNALKIGDNYAEVVGAPDGAKLVYNGGINWTESFNGQSRTSDNQKLTDSISAYMSRPATGTGIR